MKKVAVILTLLGLSAVLWTPVAEAQSTEPMVSRIYEVRWRPVEDMHRLLDPMFANMRISSNPSLSVLMITTTEKNQELIQEILKRYDVPARTIEFQFYLIRAHAGGDGLKDGVPEKIKKVIGEIAALTRYKSFEVIDSPIIRATEGKDALISGRGPNFYQIRLGRAGALVSTTDQGKRQIRVNEFGISFAVPVGADDKGNPRQQNIGVDTSFSLGDGETIVLGASQMGEEKSPGTGLVTVVTAKIQ